MSDLDVVKKEWINPILKEFGIWCRKNGKDRVGKIVQDLMQAISEDFKQKDYPEFVLPADLQETHSKATVK